MEQITGALRSLARDEIGASAIEYALLASLIAAVIVASVALLGSKLDSVYSSVKDAFN